jgi:hypothetical protein
VVPKETNLDIKLKEPEDEIDSIDFGDNKSPISQVTSSKVTKKK